MSNRQLAGYTASSVKPYIAFTAAIWAICGVTHLVVPAVLGWLDELDHLDVFGTSD
jgi:hypothetical protein